MAEVSREELEEMMRRWLKYRAEQEGNWRCLAIYLPKTAFMAGYAKR